MPLNGLLMRYTRPDLDGTLLNYWVIVKSGTLVGWEHETSCPPPSAPPPPFCGPAGTVGFIEDLVLLYSSFCFFKL